MVRGWGIGWMLACASCVTTAASGADGPKPAGGIVGQVVDIRGIPISGASVWGVSLRKEIGRVQSDAEGRFRLGSIPVDKAVDVWYEAAGMARERREGVHAFEGKDHDLGSLILVPGTRISGRVVDQGGRPIAGASIAIEVFRRVLGHTIDSDQARWEISSDAEGRFQTSSLPAGEGQLAFASTGKVRTSQYRRTMPGTAEMDLGDVKLEDEIPIRGVVVDQSGKPAPKVEVMADYDYKNTVTTDEQGRFTLGGTGKKAREIRLTSNDYFAPKPFPIGADRANLRLEVIKAYEVRGSAVDAETGAPVNVDSVRLCIVVHEPDGTTSLRG
jgi:Carboxypeptidase regulatory-like domain